MYKAVTELQNTILHSVLIFHTIKPRHFKGFAEKLKSFSYTPLKSIFKSIGIPALTHS